MKPPSKFPDRLGSNLAIFSVALCGFLGWLGTRYYAPELFDGNHLDFVIFFVVGLNVVIAYDAVSNGLFKGDQQTVLSQTVLKNYVTIFRRGQWRAIGALSTLAAVLELWLGDSSAEIIVLLAIALLASHLLVTRYRVYHGLFGSNAEETTELIQFMVSYYNETGGPPGDRFSDSRRAEENPRELSSAALPVSTSS